MSGVKQYFTVEEANRRLPLIRRIVRDIVELYKDVHERRRRLEEIRFRQTGSEEGAAIYRDEVGEIEKELKVDVDRLDGFVAELKKLNVLLKDPIRGLIDFPSRMDGRDICLCWQLDEDEIGFWHETDAGFAGRQSLFEGSVTGSDPNDSNSGE